jgi:hypothetical protein
VQVRQACLITQKKMEEIRPLVSCEQSTTEAEARPHQAFNESRRENLFEDPVDRTVETKQSITTFIEQLLAEKLIAPNGGIPDPQPWSPQFSSPFSPPVLDRFDDLRDLLFLDPVHDVSDAGWPVQAKDGD